MGIDWRISRPKEAGSRMLSDVQSVKEISDQLCHIKDIYIQNI